MNARLKQATGEMAGKDHLHIRVVRRDDPAESALLHEPSPRPTAFAAWERDLRQARAALAVMNFDVAVTDTGVPDGCGLSRTADRRQRRGTIPLAGTDDLPLVSKARKRCAIDGVDGHAAPEHLLEAIAQARATCAARPGTLAAPLVNRACSVTECHPNRCALGRSVNSSAVLNCTSHKRARLPHDQVLTFGCRWADGPTAAFWNGFVRNCPGSRGLTSRLDYRVELQDFIAIP